MLHSPTARQDALHISLTIKDRCGLRQFRCRGRLKATLEATWAALRYNLTRWFALRRRPTLTDAALAPA